MKNSAHNKIVLLKQEFKSVKINLLFPDSTDIKYLKISYIHTKQS
jgi:hypothetical protein